MEKSFKDALSDLRTRYKDADPEDIISALECALMDIWVNCDVRDVCEEGE